MIGSSCFDDSKVSKYIVPKINDKETLSKATNRLFYKDQIWPSYLELRKNSTYFGAYWGFVASRTSIRIHCNRYGKTQIRKSRPNKNVRVTTNTMKCNCPWNIRFKYVNKDDRLKSDKDRCPVIIIHVVAEHGNGCVPSKDQFTYCKTKAGLYSNSTALVLHHLVSYMVLKTNGVADAAYIRSLMRKALPNRKAIRPIDVCNVRIRANMLMRKIKAEGKDFNTFEFKPDVQKELFTPLDEITDDILDSAVVASREIYYNFLNDTSCGVSLFQYLKALAKVDIGFTYAVSRDSEGKMTGFAWMTSVMRSHFERYHSVIFLDAMKKKTNMHLWPYMAVVIVNDLGESQPVCESIMMSEGNQSYKFLIRSALKMCVNVRSNDIKVVFGDEFFTKELIQTSGLTSAKLFYDHYHLQLNQEKYLGPYLFQKSKQMLQSLLNAASHERYLCIKKALIIKFQNEPKINCLLDKYSKIEHMITAYHIDSTPGSYMRRGS